jgi:hemerythrin-like domain-containing protein
MRATEILSQEHRIIEQVLSAVDVLADQAHRTQSLDGQSATQAVDFIRNFADRCHHAKEEDLLFKAMEAAGFARDSGPLAVMLHEHEQGRSFVRQMVAAADEAGRGVAGSIDTFVEAAWSYTELLRSHIQKEDGVLYPMADRALSAEAQAELLVGFERVEAAHASGTHERYIRSARELAQRFGATAPACSGDCSSCCGHS